MDEDSKRAFFDAPSRWRYGRPPSLRVLDPLFHHRIEDFACKVLFVTLATVRKRGPWNDEHGLGLFHVPVDLDLFHAQGALENPLPLLLFRAAQRIWGRKEPASPEGSREAQPEEKTARFHGLFPLVSLRSSARVAGQQINTRIAPSGEGWFRHPVRRGGPVRLSRFRRATLSAFPVASSRPGPGIAAGRASPFPCLPGTARRPRPH